ncbi:sce7725 family protein [Sodalis ligni]|uniref:sce7725 family protein n=1 Tax=Sodalis ligni TaxID=2697027 RepID=UPI003B849C98
MHSNFYIRPNVIGFSDYTIVGSDYSEAGGPAYVVTIHLSYIEDEYKQLLIRHFSSEESNSPANPGVNSKRLFRRLSIILDQTPTYLMKLSDWMNYCISMRKAIFRV